MILIITMIMIVISLSFTVLAVVLGIKQQRAQERRLDDIKRCLDHIKDIEAGEIR